MGMHASNGEHENRGLTDLCQGQMHKRLSCLLINVKETEIVFNCLIVFCLQLF